MIKVLLIFSAFFSSRMAMANLYAPKLNEVVVLYDVAENEYSPFLFHNILDEILDMRMDASCSSIRVTKQSQILCISKGTSTVVGTIGAKVQQDTFWTAYSIQWASNVEVVESQENGLFYYAVRLK